MLCPRDARGSGVTTFDGPVSAGNERALVRRLFPMGRTRLETRGQGYRKKGDHDGRREKGRLSHGRIILDL